MLPISVIIPVYNQGRWLERAFYSAIDAGADQVIICVDASPDDSETIARRLCKGANNHLDFTSPIRCGVCFSRNFGVYSAKNDLIFCLDADDRIYPATLRRMYEAWMPNTWLYGERYVEIAEDESIIQERQTPPPGLIFRKNLSFASILFSKVDWLRAGGYDPSFEFGDEDYAFQVALTNAGVKPVQIGGDPIYCRMIHEHSRTERAVKYFPIVLEMLKEKYPATMKPQ